jgi:hypothetical protein
MNLYKITPTCGNYNAPAMYIEAENENKALEQAKNRSGLSRFKSWIFVAKQLKALKPAKQKINISGKITGLSETQAFTLFEQAEQKVVKMGMNPINPMKLSHNHNKTWVEYMIEDLKEMLKCKSIYMISNWKQSRGARIEYMLAKKLNYTILYDS